MTLASEIEALDEPTRSRVQTLATIELSRQFQTIAFDRMRNAEHRLAAAKREAQAAYDHLTRAIAMHENAIRLHSRTA